MESSHINPEFEEYDDEDAPQNEEFVQPFLTFTNFEQAARFILKWFKVDKQNINDFPADLQFIIKNAVLARLKQTYLQHEPSQIKAIFQIYKDMDVGEFKIAYILSLLDSCSQLDKMPLYICRHLIKVLEDLITNHKQKFKENGQLQNITSQFFYNVRAEVLQDYVKVMLIEDKVSYQNRIQKDLSNRKYQDCGILIPQFDLYGNLQEAELKDILAKLVDSGNIEIAKQFVLKSEMLQKELINLLSTNTNAHKAADFLQEFQLDINNFPILSERLQKKTVRYYLDKYLHKHSKDPDFVPLKKIEDLFDGLEVMMGYIVEDLTQNKKFEEAYRILLKHKLAPDFVREDVLKKLEEQKIDLIEETEQDIFGPISIPQNAFLDIKTLDLKVTLIESEDQIDQLDRLLQDKYIGIDSEWRPGMVKFHNVAPALLQLSGHKEAFLVDLIALNKNKKLDDKLTEVFKNPISTIVAFSFSSDVQGLSKKLPHMNFFRDITNFIDAQVYYADLFNPKNQTGLATVCSSLLKKYLCKGEQMSNWEKRPLRQSQIHYAALDAYILVEVIEELAKQGEKIGRLIEDHINRFIVNPNEKEEKLDVVDQKFIHVRPVVPQVLEQNKLKKKHFKKKDEDVDGSSDIILSDGLTKEMAVTNGFIFDKSLSKLAYLMTQKNINCKFLEEVKDTDVICSVAVKENRIFITTSSKTFNKKLMMMRVCLSAKLKVEEQFGVLNNFFQFE